MRFLVSKILAFIVLTSFCYRDHRPGKPDLICVLTTTQAVYKTGEVPEFQVEIINKGNKELYLLGALDGSEKKWRMPYCYFTIQKPKPDPVPFLACRTLNPLRIKDFQLVKPNESFNPYKSIDNYGFFNSHEISQQETFKNPGTYKVQFHYSTNSSAIGKFLGSQPFNEKNDSTLQKLLSKIPKVDLTSNTVELKIEN